MACFDNFIGIDGCTPTPSTSGFSLIDLGISKDNLDAIVQRDFESGQELAENKIDFAIKQIQNLVLGHFNFKANSGLGGGKVGIAPDNLDPLLANPNYVGIELEICNKRSFLSLCIPQIHLHVDYTGDVEVKVFDLKLGQEIDSITVPAVAGELVTVDISRLWDSAKDDLHLFIGYDATLVPSYKYTVFNSSCSSCALKCSPLNRFLSGRGATLDLAETPIKSNLKGNAYTGGLSFMYTISCSYEAWLCTIKNLIALPVLYKVGALISEYAIHSSRSNSDTIIDAEKWESMFKSYEFQYRESMDNVINNMVLPKDTDCFTCNSPVKFAAIIP